MMNPTVIDTLRYANRLKEAGVESRQAEAMSRAINEELTEGVAMKRDLDAAVVQLKGGIANLESRMEARFEAMDSKFESKFQAMDEKFEGKFQAMDEKFEGKFQALDAKFDTHGRYTFLVLALIAGLGLYNAAAPHFVKPAGTPTPTAAAEAAGDPRRPADQGMSDRRS